MTYSIIGTGNTAWFMATRLAAAGHVCKAVYGRNMESASQLADAINCNAFDIANGVADDADVCIMAISDHAIKEVAATLAFKHTILIHTAGAVSIKELHGAAAYYGVVWPVYSIIKTNLPDTRKIPTVWEASDDAIANQVRFVADSITDIAQQATSHQRQWLHLTAVMSNNFTNHLFAISEQLCKEQGLSFDLLHPIIQQSIDRLATLSPYSQQTGPAKRGDTTTMQRQLDMLQQHHTWQRVYEAISVSIREMYHKPQD